MNAYSVLSASSALRFGLAVFRLIHGIPSFPKRRDEAKKAKPMTEQVRVSAQDAKFSAS